MVNADLQATEMQGVQPPEKRMSERDSFGSHRLGLELIKEFIYNFKNNLLWNSF
jgi:hypothetical protein